MIEFHVGSTLTASNSSNSRFLQYELERKRTRGIGVNEERVLIFREPRLPLALTQAISEVITTSDKQIALDPGDTLSAPTPMGEGESIGSPLRRP